MSEILSAGRLEDHPFAELSGLIFQGNRTGELILENSDRRRIVWFLGGNPVAVVSADPQEHLARFLLDHGKIGERESRLLADVPETREALGTVDFIPKETLNWGVKSRFVSLCYDLFRWEAGDYSFQEGDPPRDLFMLKVPTHSLIFKGVVNLGLAAVVDAVPDDAVCGAGPVPVAEASYLTPEARRLLEQCQPGRTVSEVLGGRTTDGDQARKLLYALVCLGLVTLARGAAAADVELPGLDEAPGFLLDDGDEELTAPAPPREEPGEFSLDLPPLGGEISPAAKPGSDFDAGGAFPSPGNFPFEDESAPGSFGSFNPDASLDHHDEHLSPAEEHEDASKAGVKRSGGSIHLPRIVGIVLGSLAAAGIIGFAGWWWMSGSEPPPAPVKPPVKRPAPTAATPVAMAPPAVPTPSEPAAQALAPVPVPVPVPVPAPAAPVSAPAPAPAAPPATVAPAPALRPARGSSGGAAGERYRNALAVFRAGDLDGAAAAWEGLLAQEHRNAFTLQLLTACQPDTIRDAQRALAAQELYLVTKQVQGRSCYRVCLGTFGSREAAGRALAELPTIYRSSGASIRPVAEVLDRDR